MNSAAKITKAPIGIRHELAVLGLTPEIVQGAVQFGESFRAACTIYDPRIFWGTTAWARTLRGLRESLQKLGWRPDHTSNFETVVSPDRTRAISVSTGDIETGKYNPPHEPKLKHAKGIMYQAAIDVNTWLFEDMALDAKRKTDRLLEAHKRILWILLMRRDGDTVYSELSLPFKLTNGQVDGWKHRIILEPFEAEPLNDGVDDSDDDDGGSEIEVEVVRRS
jgi:hypothetical protein